MPHDLWMRPLKHGYTNLTVGDGSVVQKTYQGPDAELRRAREHATLTRLQGTLPVPPVHGMDNSGAVLPPMGVGRRGCEAVAAARRNDGGVDGVARRRRSADDRHPTAGWRSGTARDGRVHDR